jgi:hypothetical protein
MPEPFRATRGELAPHWASLGQEIAGVLGGPSLKVVSAPFGAQLLATFVGDSVRRAGRLRGENLPVVPCLTLSQDWEAWLGYREVWSPGAGTPNRFCFSSSDLSVYVTPAQAESFQQFLRAEWSGSTKGEDEEWQFRPTDAGHPHWHIDIGETLRADSDLEAARALLLESEPREFGDANAAVAQNPPWYQLGRMHFASGMRPWLDETIAHEPASLIALRRWVLATIQLLRLELPRLL